MLYGLLWTNTNTGEQALCEYEGGKLYEIGTLAMEERVALRCNTDAITYRWPSRYVPVPVPYAGVMDDVGTIDWHS